MVKKADRPAILNKGDKNVARVKDQNRQTTRIRNAVQDKQAVDDATVRRVLKDGR